MGRPVALSGVVTFVSRDRHELYLQDGPAGLRVAIPGPATRAVVGHRVAIEGLTTYERGAVAVVSDRERELGPGRLPPATRVSSDDLFQGLAEAKLVEVEGVVRRVGFEGGEARIALATGRNELSLAVRQAEPDDALRLVDARVRARGVAVSSVNPQGQALDPLLLVPDVESIAVLRPAPADPFAVSVVPLRYLPTLAARADGHRVHVQGVVTRHRPGHGLYLEEDGAALYVESDLADPLRPGDRVDVLGFASADRYAPMLVDATFRLLSGGRDIDPLQTTAAAVLAEALEARLVRLRGRTLEMRQEPDERLLLVSDGDVTFRAALAGGPDTPVPPGVGPGSVIDLTGVVYLRDLDQNQVPRTFDLLLRAAADVSVVEPAPSWSVARLSQALGVSLAVVLGLLVWTVALGRRARRREIEATDRLAFALAVDERYEDVLDRMSEMVYVHDRTGHLTVLNRAGEQLTGYSRDEAAGMKVADLVAPDDAARLEEIMRPGPRSEQVRTHDLRIRTRDGRQVLVSLSVRHLF